MTHACCPDCRLRLVSAAPVAASSCPGCGRPMAGISAAESIGYRLVDVEPLPLAAAVAVALPVPPGPQS